MGCFIFGEWWMLSDPQGAVRLPCNQQRCRPWGIR